MLRIGDFSRITRVTIVTLRHYDQLGLLKPTEVDKTTGYRYYSVSQLPRLHRILLLKELGFNLEQIGGLLEEQLPIEQLVGMLKLKRAEVEQQVAAEQLRLTQIEARLHLIQNEEQLSVYEILVKKVEPLPVIAIHDTLQSYGDVIYLWRELKGYMRQHGFSWVYPNLAIWQEIDYQEEEIGVVAAAPFNGKIPTTSRIVAEVLPGFAQTASTIHLGDYIGLPHAYEALIKWNELNHYQLNGPVREVYLHYDRNNPQANITEIQLPIKPI